ncbi:calcium/sodium antiporter [bacterium]|nr:calcium/sodium antiporter [bacterium]
MTTAVLLVLAGLIMLALGGEATVQGGSSIAARYRVQPYVIGATIIAFGTSAPELAVTLIASLQGAPDLALGNVVGSNIANLGLILGLAAILRPIFLHKSTLKGEWQTIIMVFVLLIGFGWNGHISRIEGIILLACMAYSTWLTLKGAKEGRVPVEGAEKPRFNTPISSVMILIGLALLFFGGRFLVNGAVIIAEAFGVSQWVIGVVIVAIGTSMPEVAASLVAALRGRADIAIGNVLGSNAFNTLLVLGTGGTITPIQASQPIRLDLAVFALLTVLTVGFLAIRQSLPRLVGILLFAIYIAYIGVSVFLLPG